MRSTDGEGEGADKRDFLMNEPETIDPRELNPLALAFVGDSVLVYKKIEIANSGENPHNRAKKD